MISFITIVMFWWKKNFDALNAEGKISLDWMYSSFASLDNNIPMFFLNKYDTMWSTVDGQSWVKQLVLWEQRQVSKPNTGYWAQELLTPCQHRGIRPQWSAEWKAICKSKGTTLKTWKWRSHNNIFLLNKRGRNIMWILTSYRTVQLIWMSRKC